MKQKSARRARDSAISSFTLEVKSSSSGCSNGKKTQRFHHKTCEFQGFITKLKISFRAKQIHQVSTQKTALLSVFGKVSLVIIKLVNAKINK